MNRMHYLESIQGYQPANPQEAADQRLMLHYIKEYPDTVLTRENAVAHLTSSGLILNASLDKMLMVHHNIYNTWAWTGGHADGDSDLLAVAIREGQEETGVRELTPLSEEIASIDVLPVYGHVRKGQYVSTHLHLNVTYVLIADEKHQLQANEDENSGVTWVPVDALAAYSNEPYLIEVYLKIVEWAKGWRCCE